MVNKKAYIRTLEAIIAIALLLILTYSIIPRTVKPREETPKIVSSAQEFIIKEISLNETIRECIVTENLCYNNPNLISVIEKNIPPAYDYTFCICDSTECIAGKSPCTNPPMSKARNLPIDKSVYMSDILLASTVEDSDAEQNPKIFRLWIWRK